MYLLILKKVIFNRIDPQYFPIWQSKEMTHDFVRGQSVAETCFSCRAQLGLGLILIVLYSLFLWFQINRVLTYPVTDKCPLTGSYYLHLGV